MVSVYFMVISLVFILYMVELCVYVLLLSARTGELFVGWGAGVVGGDVLLIVFTLLSMTNFSRIS